MDDDWLPDADTHVPPPKPLSAAEPAVRAAEGQGRHSGAQGRQAQQGRGDPAGQEGGGEEQWGVRVS